MQGESFQYSEQCREGTTALAVRSIVSPVKLHHCFVSCQQPDAHVAGWVEAKGGGYEQLSVLDPAKMFGSCFDADSQPRPQAWARGMCPVRKPWFQQAARRKGSQQQHQRALVTCTGSCILNLYRLQRTEVFRDGSNFRLRHVAEGTGNGTAAKSQAFKSMDHHHSAGMTEVHFATQV